MSLGRISGFLLIVLFAATAASAQLLGGGLRGLGLPTGPVTNAGPGMPSTDVLRPNIGDEQIFRGGDRAGSSRQASSRSNGSIDVSRGSVNFGGGSGSNAGRASAGIGGGGSANARSRSASTSGNASASAGRNSTTSSLTSNLSRHTVVVTGGSSSAAATPNVNRAALRDRVNGTRSSAVSRAASAKGYAAGALNNTRYYGAERTAPLRGRATNGVSSARNRVTNRASTLRSNSNDHLNNVKARAAGTVTYTRGKLGEPRSRRNGSGSAGTNGSGDDMRSRTNNRTRETGEGSRVPARDVDQ